MIWGLINCVGSNRETPNTKWQLRRDSDRERTAKFLRMEKLIADLDTQLKLLNFARTKGQAIVEKRNTEGIKRHRDALQAIMKTVENQKLQIKQAKFANGAATEDVAAWSSGIEKD